MKIRQPISDKCGKVSQLPCKPNCKKTTSELWRDFFSNPSEWWDNRSNKTNPRYPDFRHKITKEPLWIHDFQNPPWVEEELAKRRTQSLKHGEACTKMETKAPNIIDHDDDTHNAILLCQNHQHDNATTVLASLKSFAKQKDLCNIRKIYTDVLQTGLLKMNIYLGNSLISAYVKCGAIAEAQEVFDNLPVRTTVSWTSLISGYAEHGDADTAFYCFEKMQHKGFLPNSVTFICMLKLCGTTAMSKRGRELHAEVARRDLLRNNHFLGNALVDMYAKCGSLTLAEQAFDELLVQDVVSFNTLISGYLQHGPCADAIDLFEQMDGNGFHPDEVSYTCILKACGKIGAFDKGQTIHTEIVRLGLMWKTVTLDTTIVDMYARCGSLKKAKEIFDKITNQNVVTWNALISGYTQNGYDEEAISCYDKMQSEGFLPDLVTFACVLKACGSSQAFDNGQEIHAEIVRKGLLTKPTVLGTALVDMYAKCGKIAKMKEVVHELPSENLNMWNTVVDAYAKHDRGEEAFSCYERMQSDKCHMPDIVTFVCLLKACSKNDLSKNGALLHTKIINDDLFGKNVVLDTALVDMYATCGDLQKAERVFNELPFQNVVSCNALLTGYVEHGLDEAAIDLFKKMELKDLSPNEVTFACILKACGNMNAVDNGEQIHSVTIRQEMLYKSSMVGSALMDMYARFGDTAKAQQIFDDLQVRDLVSWNTIIAGYALHGQFEEAVKCFKHMQCEGVSPDAVTFTCTLRVCGIIGAEDKGEEIHIEIVRHGLLGKDTALGSSLVEMYSRCGALSKAQQVFDELPVQNVVTWTALITGYSQLGMHETVLNSFKKMIRDGTKPDPVIFTVVLKTCGCSGLISEGQMYIESMSANYGLIPTVEHQACMVGAFANVGCFDEAMANLMVMTSSHHLPAWFSLLFACKKWGNFNFGRFVFEHVVRFNRYTGNISDETHAMGLEKKNKSNG